MVATHTADLELTLVFAEAMETAGAPGAALANPLSYALKSNSGLGLPSGTVYPSGVTVISPTLLRLTIPYTTSGEEYRLEIVGALETATGSLITGALYDWDSVTSKPRVTQVTPKTVRTVEVSFDREMEDNADLLNPSAYVFNGGLRADLVEKIDPSSVRVTLNSLMTPGQEYLLSVKANP